VAGVSYWRARRAAVSLGISAQDSRLWSDAGPVRALLRHFGIKAAPQETPFQSWSTLPDLALIALKWHRENRIPFWHWAVFAREGASACVLDSKKALRRHVRTDFGRMKPKWFIQINRRRSPVVK